MNKKLWTLAAILLVILVFISSTIIIRNGGFYGDNYHQPTPSEITPHPEKPSRTE